MNKSRYNLIGWILLGVAASAATGAVCMIKSKKTQRRLLTAANEGYETAHDIIYPNSHGRQDKKLRYGPVF